MSDRDPAALQSAATDRSTDYDRRTEEPSKRVRVPVAGGVLVYEDQALDRELVGFENVEDWNDLRTALAARGHDAGALHHKPVLDGGE